MFKNVTWRCINHSSWEIALNWLHVATRLTCCSLHVCVLLLETARRREREVACVCQIGSKPRGAEGLQSAVRTARSGQPTDSWLPQMMHWHWHPNWPQCLSQWAWCVCVCAPVCVSACVCLCLVEAQAALVCALICFLCASARVWYTSVFCSCCLNVWACLCAGVCAVAALPVFLNVHHIQRFGLGCTFTDLSSAAEPTWSTGTGRLSCWFFVVILIVFKCKAWEIWAFNAFTSPPLPSPWVQYAHAAAAYFWSKCHANKTALN